jgi:hypothetical protein
MKKSVLIIFTTCLLSSCSNKVYYSSSWQKGKVTVDGKISEWSDPLRFYDQETGISYSISNDRYNLYLCCSISNEFLQTKILRSGLEFGIDTLGKKSFSTGIKYPVVNSADAEPKPNTNPQYKAGFNERSDRSAYKIKLIAEAREIQLTGFKPQFGKLISLSDPNNTGISAAISFDRTGIMNYEAVIPFSTFYKDKLTPTDSSKIFNYQIKISPLAKSDTPAGRSGGARSGENNGGGMRGGRMGGGVMRGGGMRGGGMNGGGMRGGMNGGGMRSENAGNHNQNSSMSGITKTTIKLKLAYR